MGEGGGNDSKKGLAGGGGVDVTKNWMLLKIWFQEKCQ